MGAVYPLASAVVDRRIGKTASCQKMEDQVIGILYNHSGEDVG
jgi:hypothetical protein